MLLCASYCIHITKALSLTSVSDFSHCFVFFVAGSSSRWYRFSKISTGTDAQCFKHGNVRMALYVNNRIAGTDIRRGRA